MKAKQLLLRIYGEQVDGQWTLICLEFSLAVQAESLKLAEEKMRQQIHMYVNEATVGQDREHASVLLNRSAPLKYWVKFYWHALRQLLAHKKKTRVAENQALPLVLNGA